MTNVIQNVYPKDLTMSLASNHVEREKKLFTGAEDRIFVPDGGPFYSQSLIIKDNNGKVLKPQVEYQLLYLNEGATIESGRDVVTVINVLKSTIPYVMLDYRVVGGGYGNTVNAIIQEITKAGPIQKNVDWNVNVFGKPVQFPPAPHYHTPDSFSDWKMIYTQLEGMRKAILVGDDPSWESHYNYIDRVINALEQNFNGTLNNYATKSFVSGAIGSIDLTVDLSGYYKKTEVDTRITQVDGKINGVTGDLSTNYYTKSQSDAKYPLKTASFTKSESDGKYALKSDSYNKSESDGKYALKTQLSGYVTTNTLNQLDIKLSNRINQAIEGSGVDLSGYYTKLQTYAKSEVYSKSETYSRSQVYSTSEIDAKLRAMGLDISSVTTSVNNFVPTYRIVNKSGNYTVLSADLKGDTIIRCISGNATTITLPAIGSGMTIGTTITIRQVGAGIVTINGASGVNISPADSLKLRRAGVTATLVYVSNNSFDLITELE